ncbi:MAG TPA: threonine--tRNA ligase [Candidatus Latescibacteria bacterium]|nr:threonine--tRNA ligase [Candidatus Latescibacterota bacterium]HQE61314.1 threonine--tRNA ligase [Candidatus Latescibacterota bacterium]HQI75931.1 threonine--tRNA ligase [Candidatus Latescibacterota bacterium]
MVRVTLPDGTPLELHDGATALDAAEKIGPRLAKATLAAKINDLPVDATTALRDGDRLALLTWDSPEGRDVYRHTTSHIMAQAVKRLFPEAKPAIGPALEDRFYYDFEVGRPFSPEDLEKIEAEMAEIIKEDLPVTRFELPVEEAIKLFSDRDEPYKVEILRDLSDQSELVPGEKVSLYQQGEYVDLCRGPHLPSTGRVKAFKLLSSSGAYWRGDEKRQMLQRIYGTSFPDRKQLESFLAVLEEAKRRDHRILGPRLDLFSIHPEVGAGLIHWHPKGALIRHLIETLWKEEHMRRGYSLVYTPHIASDNLYRISGHLEKYDAMYRPMDIDGENYRVKPMNCPFHIMIYQSQTRSYRDLPIRYAELGTVYRYERSGVLHGMLRVRGFTQDDAHIFCRPDQLVDEVSDTLDLMKFFLSTFGLDYQVYLSTRPERSFGTDEEWAVATDALKETLEKAGVPYTVDPGEGVFYGPKIDVKLLDVLGRPWQGPTIQVDFQLPQRFGVEYVGSDNQTHNAVMVHRAMLGSMERFVGCLIEHFAGAFPLWISPVQVVVLPLTEAQTDSATELAGRLKAAGLRVETDLRSEKIGSRIRDAELQRVPYMLILGAREVENGAVAVRARERGDLGAKPVDEVIRLLCEEVSTRSLTPKV